MEKLEYSFAGKGPAPENYEQLRVEWANAAVFEKKDHYECDICKDKGWIARLGELGMPVYRDCDCTDLKRNRKKYADALAASGLGTRFQTQTFENFQIQERWMAEFRKAVMAWVESERCWLLLSGQSGCGKTHLAMAACRARLVKRGQNPLVLSWRDYFGAQSRGNNKEKVLDMIRQAKDAPLLYIDDFLKTARNYWDVPSWEQDLAFELIDYRYNMGLDTVISTEWLPEELREMNDAIAGRIHHAAGRNICVIPKDPAKNFRYRGSFSA